MFGMDHLLLLLSTQEANKANAMWKIGMDHHAKYDNLLWVGLLSAVVFNRMNGEPLSLSLRTLTDPQGTLTAGAWGNNPFPAKTTLHFKTTETWTCQSVLCLGWIIMRHMIIYCELVYLMQSSSAGWTMNTSLSLSPKLPNTLPDYCSQLARSVRLYSGGIIDSRERWPDIWELQSLRFGSCLSCHYILCLGWAGFHDTYNNLMWICPFCNEEMK